MKERGRKRPRMSRETREKVGKLNVCEKVSLANTCTESANVQTMSVLIVVTIHVIRMLGMEREF